MRRKATVQASPRGNAYTSPRLDFAPTGGVEAHVPFGALEKVLAVLSMKRISLLCLVAVGASACASTPAAPFDTLKNANVVAYRLQNYEPPAPQAGVAPGMIPGLPPQILQWAQQAAPALQQMIPPGLIPPGLIPGLQTGGVAPAQDAPRFHGFRILEQAPVVDGKLREQLGELLGDEDSFQSQHANCLYAEMGLSFSTNPGAPPNDVLISFSCNQMQGHNFIWPHPTTGMTSETVKTFSEVVARLFPVGTGAPMAMVQL